MDNYSVIYEPSFSISPYAILIPIAIIASVVLLAVFWKKIRWPEKIFMMLVSAVLIVAVVGMVSSSLTCIELINKYKNGEAEVVEGIITEYREDGGRNNDVDSFYVADKYFDIAETTVFGLGYNLRRENGGVLTNGTKVRISYIQYGSMNIMMKLEVAK